MIFDKAFGLAFLLVWFGYWLGFGYSCLLAWHDFALLGLAWLFEFGLGYRFWFVLVSLFAWFGLACGLAWLLHWLGLAIGFCLCLVWLLA